MTKTRSLLKLLRPFTLLAPAVGGFFFGLMGIRDAGLNVVESLPLLFLSGFILAMANATSNIFNQVFDVDIDKLHPVKKHRPVASGEIAVGDALSFGVFLMLCTLALALLVFNIGYGLSLSVIMFFVWIYNCPPIRMKRRFVWSNVAIAAPRGGLGITCAYSAFADPFNPVMYVAIIYFALYVFGTNTLKDFADAEYDEQCGVRNFVTVWGKEKALKLVGLFMVIPFAWLYVATNFVNIPMISLLPILFSAYIIYLMLQSGEGVSIEGNSKLWVMFYLQFATMMILFTLPRILGG